jgi:tetratricopeptide (TPR) repeat protein
MLHSEVALRALRSNDERATDVHLSLARRLLDRTVRLSRPQKDFAWRWDMAIPSAVERLGGREIALRLKADAQERWVHDTGRQAFLRGLILERHGARMARDMVVGESRNSAPAKLRGAWSEAAIFFVSALREDPSLRAAALHLGRLRMLQGQRVEAATLFRSALVDTTPAVAYLAALFLGSLEQREGRFDAAERLYRAAVARIPLGQSAPLALAELLCRTGREPEARDVLAAHVLRPGAALVEPMWAFGPPFENPGVQIDLLRLEVWK